MQNRDRANTKKIALCGLLLALLVMVLFIASFIPVNRLSLLALASFAVSIVIIEFGLGAGWVFYAASCLLGFIVVQNKLLLIPYILFFGIYGIIKCYIEKINNIVFEYILKFAYFNIFLAGVLLLVKEFFLENITVKIPLWAVVALLEVLFFIYDYVYTLFILYYNGKLKKILRL